MHLFHTDPGNRNFLEQMRGCHCTGCMFCCHRLGLRIVKGPLIVFGRLPNCIVDKYTAPGNPAVKLCGDKSWLPLHDFSFGCPCSWEPMYILRFHIELIDQNNWANIFSSICMESVIFS